MVKKYLQKGLETRRLVRLPNDKLNSTYMIRVSVCLRLIVSFILFSSSVCSRHFDSSCFIEGGKQKKLKLGSLPTIFPEYPCNKQADAAKSVLKRKAPAIRVPMFKEKSKTGALQFYRSTFIINLFN